MTELRLWRSRQGLSLAAASKRLGMSVSMLWMIETGRLKPSAVQSEKLREGTGIEPSALLRPIRSRVR
jgi:transcriptional regulator with XRE-family HTH domain